MSLPARGLLRWITPTLRQAGRMALAARRADLAVRDKADHTPVSAVDEQIEALLAARIRSRFPAERILAEEGNLGGDDPAVTWVLDPLDGSRAYLSGLPVWGISVGILQQGVPIAGAFYLPAVGELYTGHPRGAFLNGRRLLPPALGLEDRTAFLAVPSNWHQLYTIDYPRLRSLGSAAAHLVYVGRGAAVGALLRPVRLWDLAGVWPLLSALGIELRYLSGAAVEITPLLDGRAAPEPILAARAALIEPLLQRITSRQADTE
ncbi:MAG: inositol monophosphatase [Caldilineales bacterium]